MFTEEVKEYLKECFGQLHGKLDQIQDDHMKKCSVVLQQMQQQVNEILMGRTKPNKNLYRIICHTNPFSQSVSGKDPYTIETDQELHPGDVIRNYDDYNNTSAVVIKRREYDASTHVFYLYCEACETFNDYIYTDGYKNAVHNWVAKNKSKFLEGVRPDGQDIRNMMEVLTKHRTCMNWQHVWDRTEEILSSLLGYSIPPKQMVSF